MKSPLTYLCYSFSDRLRPNPFAGSCDDSHAVLHAQPAAVQAQIVVAHGAPLLIGVGAVVVGPGLVPAGEFVNVRITGAEDGDLVGEIEE